MRIITVGALRKASQRHADLEQALDDWYQIAKLQGQLTFWIVFAIAVYLPFEEFILKWTPAPSIVLLFLRFLHEFIIYFLFMKVFYKRLINGDRLIKSSKYIPKKLESKIIRMNNEKAPVEKILKVLQNRVKRKR